MNRLNKSRITPMKPKSICPPNDHTTPVNHMSPQTNISEIKEIEIPTTYFREPPGFFTYFTSFFSNVIFLVILTIKNGYSVFLSILMFFTVMNSYTQTFLYVAIGFVVAVSILDFIVLCIWIGPRHWSNTFQSIFFVGIYRECICYRMFMVIFYSIVACFGFWIYTQSFNTIEIVDFDTNLFGCSTLNVTQCQLCQAEDTSLLAGLTKIFALLVPLVLIFVRIYQICVYNGTSSYKYVKLLRKYARNGTMHTKFPEFKIHWYELIALDPDKFLQDVITPLGFIDELRDIKKLKELSSFSHYNWRLLKKLKCDEEVILLKDFFFDYKSLLGEERCSVLIFASPMKPKWWCMAFCCCFVYRKLIRLKEESKLEDDRNVIRVKEISSIGPEKYRGLNHGNGDVHVVSPDVINIGRMDSPKVGRTVSMQRKL